MGIDVQGIKVGQEGRYKLFVAQVIVTMEEENDRRD